MLSTYRLASPAMKLYITTDTLLLACPRDELRIEPHVATEQGRFAPDLNVAARHAYLSEAASVSEYQITNTGHQPQAVRLAFAGRAAVDEQRYMVRYFAGVADEARVSVLDQVDDRTICLGLRSDESALATVMMRWVLLSASHPIELEVGTDPLAYAYRTPDAFTLKSGEQARFQFRCDVIAWESESRSVSFPAASPMDVDDAIACAAQHAYKHLGRPARPPKSALDALALRARHALYRCGYSGTPGGRFGQRTACLCTPDSSDFSCACFWDTLFSAVAIAGHDPAYAADAIRTAFVGHDDRDGSTPERKWDVAVNARMPQQSPQSPVASWAVRRVCEMNSTFELAAEMLPMLERNHAFWRDYSDTDRDGLAEYRWSGQAADNSPLWDWYSTFDGVGGCGWLPPVAFVALNAFLYWDANELATLCRRLGRPAGDWEDRALAIRERLLATCYHPSDRRFYDYNHHLRQHRRINNLYNYWPLVAQMCLPKDLCDEWIDQELLDPKKYFGAIPFPTVAYDEREYDPHGY